MVKTNSRLQRTKFSPFFVGPKELALSEFECTYPIMLTFKKKIFLKFTQLKEKLNPRLQKNRRKKKFATFKN
jgi:hypothetical protein